MTTAALFKVELFVNQDIYEGHCQQDVENLERSIVVKLKIFRIAYHRRQDFYVNRAIDSLHAIRSIIEDKHVKAASEVREGRDCSFCGKQVRRTFLNDVSIDPTYAVTDVPIVNATETTLPPSNLPIFKTKTILGILSRMVIAALSFWIAPNVLFLF